ncbi:MAG TPA: ferric reductase-like transmembrane domain-containing protein, partial [Candidatus Acidoferrales bacterium]|nr:ferric reductase-like transmembrane domain-containing protein [Candidatus Acidoferrales bacterium]
MTRAARAYLAVFAANVVAVVAFWWVGLDRTELGTAADALNAAGRLAALVGTYLLLVQLILRTHVPWLASAFGNDGLKRVHVWNAYLAVALIGAHVVFQVVGYALQERIGILDELAVMLAQYEGMLPAVAGALLLGALTLLAIDRFRHQLAWPTWRALHFYTYAAVALSLPHIIATGSDFIGAPAWSVYWVALETVVIAVLVIARVPPIWRAPPP